MIGPIVSPSHSCFSCTDLRGVEEAAAIGSQNFVALLNSNPRSAADRGTDAADVPTLLEARASVAESHRVRPMLPAISAQLEPENDNHAQNLPWNAGERFDALGMFGRHGATAAIPSSLCSQVDDMAALARRSERAAVDNAVSASLPSPADVATEFVEDLSMRSTGSAPFRVASGQLAVLLAPPPALEEAEPESTHAAQRTLRDMPRLPLPSSSPLALHVDAVDGALSIFARAPGNVDELRRALEHAAAEFGIDVTELRLNGIEQPLAQVSRTGGRNGSRSR